MHIVSRPLKEKYDRELVDRKYVSYYQSHGGWNESSLE